MDGVIAGGQVGYNWQTGNWVCGVEADFQGSDERAARRRVHGGRLSP